MTFPCLCVAGVLLALLLPSARADSFVGNGTVVVLVGLPGDMESEKTYGDQTLRLLQLLDRPELAPKKVLLLTSVAAPADFKPGYSLDILHNDRATFLGLADQLKTDPGPFTFFVFGHGGNQGHDSVFHVPGPRLLPADFAAVAAGEPASTWSCSSSPAPAILPRRFRRPSARSWPPRRTTRFSPRTRFPSACFSWRWKKTPISTSSAWTWVSRRGNWYSSRQLARTEDPALWVEMQPPRKLTLSIEGAGTSVSDGSIRPNPPAATNPVPETAPPPAPVDAVWQTITPVDPAKYPQSDAITLSRNVSYVIDDNNGVSEDEETFLQILKPEGKRYGDFQFSFSPPKEDLNFLACEVRLPNGQIEALNPDEIRDGAKAAPEDYDVEKRKLFSFPHIEPGAIIRIHLQRQWKNFPMPHLYQEIPLADENPVAALKVEVRLPRKDAFHFKLLRQPVVDPVVTQSEYGSIFTWQFHDQPPVLQEPLSPPEQTPELVVTTFPDWGAFSDWYIRLIRESNNPAPELTQQAQTLIAGATSDEDKIERIARFVTNFRYVSVPLGVNSFRPHSALHVWQNRYGDCKDKANLLGTLLTAVGFKTHLVLVPRFSQAYPDLPGFAFNHAIAQVVLPDKTLWIDTTDDVCRFGLLPPGDPGRQVLVIDEKVDSLTPLPEAQATDHRLTLDMDVTLPDTTARETAVQVQAGGAGYADYLLRAAAKAAGSHQVLPLLGMSFTTTSGIFSPEHQQATAVDDLEHPFTWKADGSWDGLVSRLPQSSTELMRLPGWVPQEWRIAMLPRSNPLHLNQGYPMEIVETWHIHLPHGATNVKLPSGQSDPGPQLAWNLSWSSAPNDEMTAKLDITLAQADLDQNGTRAFQSSSHHLQETLQDGLSFQTP